jgi:pimeloyl-ACP methyl ester carboxylesterase
MKPQTRSFQYREHELVYEELGSGERVVVLLPSLLLSRRMHGPLAATLAEHGHRVLCLDLLGHGDSDRPEEMWCYSMAEFGAQAIALLDHLEVEAAVLGGTSLGANASLEAAAAAPARVKGLLIEMPVLDNALLGCALAFTPLLVGLTFGAPVARTVARGARLLPRGLSLLADIALDSVSQDPKPSASLLQGLFFGRTAPPRELRREMKHPTLVIGHGRDPVHPFSDSDMLAREMPNARLVEASSILELRLTPERLTDEIVVFVEDCFRSKPAARGRRRGGAATRRGAHPRS